MVPQDHPRPFDVLEDGFVPVVSLRRYNRRQVAQPGTDHPFVLASHPHVNDSTASPTDWFGALQRAELEDHGEDDDSSTINTFPIATITDDPAPEVRLQRPVPITIGTSMGTLRDYKNFGFVEAGLRSWPVLPQGHAIAAAAHTLMSTRRGATSSNFQRSNPTSTLRENVSFAWDCFCPHQNCAFSCVDNGPRRRLALAPPLSDFHSASTDASFRPSDNTSRSTTTSARHRDVRRYSGRTVPEWNRTVYKRGVRLDDHGAITLDALASHQHTVDLRKRTKDKLNKVAISSTLANANLDAFCRQVDELCERLDRVRPVVHANDIYCNIDMQRDATPG